MIYCPYCGTKNDSGTLCYKCKGDAEKYDDIVKQVDDDVKEYLEYAKLYTGVEYNEYIQAEKYYNRYLEKREKLKIILQECLSFFVVSMFVAYLLIDYYESFVYLLIMIPSIIIFSVPYFINEHTVKKYKRYKGEYRYTEEIFKRLESSMKRPNISYDYLKPEVILQMNELIFQNNAKTMKEVDEIYEHIVYPLIRKPSVSVVIPSTSNSYYDIEREKKEALERQQREENRRREEEANRRREQEYQEYHRREQEEYYRYSTDNHW